MAWSCVWHLREAWYHGKWHHQRKKHKERGIGMAFKEAAEVFSDPYALEVFDSANSTLEESRYKVLGRVKRQVVVVVVYTPRRGKSRISRALFLNISA